MVFYLGQTYELIGDAENALAIYQKRIDMRGWLQEVFEAHLRRVQHLQKIHCHLTRHTSAMWIACASW